MHPSTSLCVHSLFLSRMQSVAGLDWGWGKWEECFWVLSPCDVIVDRDGSCSEWGQRRGNTGPHHRTWGWQLFGLYRYCSCFLMILNESLCANVSLGKCQAGLRQWLRQDAFEPLYGKLYYRSNQSMCFHQTTQLCREMLKGGVTWWLFHPNKHTQRIQVWRKWHGGDTCFVVALKLKSVFTVSVNEKAERLTSLGDLLDLTWLQTKGSLN